MSYETHAIELHMTERSEFRWSWHAWVRPPITAHKLLHAFLQFLLAPSLHHHLWVWDCPRKAGFWHVLVDLCCQTTVFPKPQNEEDDGLVRIHNMWKNKKTDRGIERSKLSLFFSFGTLCAFVGAKKKQDPLQGLVRCLTESVFMLPILPVERLLISIRNPGKLFLPLLFLLFLLFGQSPLEVLNYSVLLLFWSITLTLLTEKGVEENNDLLETAVFNNLFILFKYKNILRIAASIIQVLHLFPITFSFTEACQVHNGFSDNRSKKWK